MKHIEETFVHSYCSVFFFSFFLSFGSKEDASGVELSYS